MPTDSGIDFGKVGLDTVLFLGAGASKPLGLPLMNEFFARIAPGGALTKLRRYGGEEVAQPAYQGVLRIVSALYPNVDPTVPGAADLERVLAWLDNTCGWADRDEGGLVPLLSMGHMGPGVLKTWQQAADLEGQARRAMGQASDHCLSWTREARNYLRSMLWHTYATVDETKARNLYYPLLRPLYLEPNGSPLCPIAVFTTNYDRAVEVLGEWSTAGRAIDVGRLKADRRAAESAAIVIADGFHPHTRLWERETLVRQISSPSQFGGNPTRSMAYFKLHGSLDWRAQGGATRVAGVEEEPIDTADRAVIVYPGADHELESEPFATAHRALADCLAVARRCICIGFAFRSTTIASIFSDALERNRSLQLLMVDPKGSEVAARTPDHRRLWEHERCGRVEEAFSEQLAALLAER